MSDSTLIKDIAILGLGMAGGFLISSHFYRKGKTDSEETESNLIAVLDRNYEQALRNGVRDTSMLHAIRAVESEVESLSDLVVINEKLEEVLTKLDEIKSGEEPPVDLVLRYKALGDRWSELISEQLNLRLFDENGTITRERLLSVHKSIFPENYPWAGVLRKEHVYVVDNFGTTARVVDLASAQSKISTISPDKIEENLDRLFNHWNAAISGLVARDSNTKIEEVAHFHHEFEIIHPFLDGNGRIGRMLLEDQLQILFQSQVVFRPERDDYYRALRMLNMGDANPLSALIKSELVKFNAIL